MDKKLDSQEENKNSQEFLDLVDYIRENRASYGIDALRKGLLKQGVSYAEIKSAMEYIEEEEEKKISKFMDESGDEEDIDDEIILGEDFGEGKKFHLKKRADKLIGAISTSVGGGKKMGKLYLDVFKYGAVSFLFFSVIVYFFKYLGGAYIYPKVAADAGFFSHLAVPDVFLVQFGIWYLLFLLAWSAVLGGVISVVFIKFLAKIWPFSNWFKLQQKTFVFYILFEFIFGVFINGILSAFSWVYLIGYLIVLVGIGIGSYLASNYFAIVLENKYEDQIRQITR